MIGSSLLYKLVVTINALHVTAASLIMLPPLPMANTSKMLSRESKLKFPKPLSTCVSNTIENKALVREILIKCSLVGTFKVSGVFPLSAGQAYCVPNGILENTKECSCSNSAANLEKMDALSDGKPMVMNSTCRMLIK